MAFCGTVYTDTFTELFVMLPEQRQQGSGLLSNALNCVFNQHSRDESQFCSDMIVVSLNIGRKAVDSPVDFKGIPAAAVRTAGRRVPEFRVQRHFRPYLRCLSVDAYFAQ